MTSSPGREALLRATVAVVADQGLRALTYRAVAAQAGVSHGLVRHHFGSRDQLIAAALEFAIDDSLRETSMHDDIETADDFASGIESLATRSTDVQAFQYELLLESRRRPELRPHVERYYETYREATHARLRRLGVDDEELVQAIWFALDGIVLKQLTLGGGDDIDRVLTRIRRLVREAASNA
ncbi:TetR/AcrR family transcriptional regulator [Microbacterium esteraromaticum]|uniref:TetR/AcrR family transcriptional regulator n=1 Tax=Microbacterium esteraromaticum TaxID=57043 RepID=UPI001C94153A|nr:TetR family transcriptional regulator [Microbacterium esteraromaticum]MBY6060450.1 TetR family transcriptional regulator [Microbacterium esteraromaticum]